MRAVGERVAGEADGPRVGAVLMLRRVADDAARWRPDAVDGGEAADDAPRWLVLIGDETKRGL